MNYQEVKDNIGKLATATVPTYGRENGKRVPKGERTYRRLEIMGFYGGSQTRVLLKDLDRGKGWDEISKSYKGCSRSGGWFKGKNYSYGETLQLHRKHLTKLIND